ncbi:MAG TPA: glucose-6-phosphate dehydrogenase assembly protein OpcA [Chlamydiales bacterium]|nr:glucose-6-phosphate dehydrogenase assembly protein OpcA [Chlamydiales bacterium]
MTIQQIIDPAKIESELIRLWEGLAKENKMRACLFNLIVFNQLSARTDYVRSIVQKVIGKFPCRVLFISYDPDAKQAYLKTAVSVVTPKNEESIACDHIDIGVAGHDLKRIPFLLLPHIIPDLPVYLLWTEDPCKENSLFDALAKLSHRLIFDSECADNLIAFSEKVLALHKTGIEIADLNWARTEGWRDLLTSTFDAPDRQEALKHLASVQITYNAKETEFFCHLKVQSIYLMSWLSARLKWKIEPEKKIEPTRWEKLGPGTIVSVELKTTDEQLFQCMRLPDQYHYVGIQISTLEKCELPFQFLLGKTATGQSLVQEITRKETSAHYLEMLKELTHG